MNSSRDSIATYENKYTKGMKLLNSYHSGMAGYLMDFGFGGYHGYGGGVSSLLVMKELRRRMMYDG